jgi:hypothetical protein
MIVKTLHDASRKLSLISDDSQSTVIFLGSLHDKIFIRYFRK